MKFIKVTAADKNGAKPDVMYINPSVIHSVYTGNLSDYDGGNDDLTRIVVPSGSADLSVLYATETIEEIMAQIEAA